MVAINILDKEWKFYIHDDENYISQFGTDSGAFVTPDNREGHFCADDFSLVVVKHELCHAWIATVPVGSARLNKGQLEEMYCDIFSEYGDLMLRQARYMYKQLKAESGE